MTHPRRFIFVSVAASVLFALLAFAVVSRVTNSVDTAVLLAINGQESDLLDAFFLTVTQFGGTIAIAGASIALCAALMYKKRYKKVLFVVGSMGGMITLNLILKALFDRPRPDLWEWIVTETSLSFPSGHATASMALVLVVLFLVWNTRYRRWAIWFGALFVVLVGMSRLYLGVHFPTDIIGGWLLATTWVSLMAALTLTETRKPLKESEPA